MTALLAVLALAQSAPLVIEHPVPDASSLAFVAVASLPDLTPRERTVLEVVARAIPAQTQDYTRSQIEDLTAGGSSVRTVVMTDHVRIEFRVVPQAMKIGAGLIDSLVSRAVLAQDVLDRAQEDLAGRDPGLWETALDPSPRLWTQVLQPEAMNLYRRIFGRGSISVAIGGPFSPGDALKELENRVSRWPVQALPPAGRPARGSVEGRYVAPGLGWTELRSPVIPARDVALGTRLLVATALGVGKGSTLHRIIRERDHLSYRQEAILWPVSKGWQLRLIALQKLGDSPTLSPAEMRKKVLEDIEAWTPAEVDRAMGMLEGSLVNGIPWGALTLEPNASIGRDLQDETFLNAYWPLKTGRRWDRASLLLGLRNIKVNELKDLAKEAVTSAEAIQGPPKI